MSASTQDFNISRKLKRMNLNGLYPIWQVVRQYPDTTNNAMSAYITTRNTIGPHSLRNVRLDNCQFEIEK